MKQLIQKIALAFVFLLAVAGVLMSCDEGGKPKTPKSNSKVVNSGEQTTKTESSEQITKTESENGNFITIKLDYNGGQSSSFCESVTIDKLSAEVFPFDLKKENSNFRGWECNGVLIYDEFGNLANNIDLIDDMTFKARFVSTAKLTIVSNMENAGDLGGGKECSYYSYCDIFAHPKQGYKFVGWYQINNETLDYDILVATEQDYKFLMWTEDVTIQAKFEIVPFELNIYSNNADLGLVYDTSAEAKTAVDKFQTSHAYLSTVTVSAITSTDTYRFLGWYDENNVLVSPNAVYTFNMVNHDLTLEAKWNRFDISYDLDGGEQNADNPTSFSIEDTKTLHSPTKEHYTFIGWELDGVNITSVNGTVAKHILLKAKWQANSYMVTVSTDDTSIGSASIFGTSDKSKLFDYNSSVTLIATTDQNGYVFNGWYNGDTKVSSELQYSFDMPGNSVSYNAKWIINTNTPYVVNHYQQNINDDEYTLFASENLTGTAYTTITPNVNTYTGFTSPATQTTTVLPDGSGVVDYYYTRNYYTVTVVGNGGTNNQIALKYQSTIHTTGWTTRDGYMIGGFYNDSKLTSPFTNTTMPAENKTIYAYWEGDSFPHMFTYSSSSIAITITGYTGPSTTVKIPSQIGGIPVTSIGENAFKVCTELTSITIPDTVTSIGRDAFYGCTGLKSVTILGSVTSIGYSVFYGCTRLTSITIPDSVTSIGWWAFKDCTNLANISYGGDFAGWNKICADIMYYGKSQKVLTIGGNEVSGEFTIPEGVTTINSYAFYNCTGLTSIIIPESVTSIGYNAFYGCTGLTSITIPDSVTSIGSGAFRGCTGLTSIIWNVEKCTVGGSLFDSCFALTSVIFGEKVKNIPSVAFGNCTRLTSITIPDSVTSIGESAFKGCTNLTSITIPDSVTSVGSSAFGNTAWYYAKPDGVVYIGHALYEYKGTMPSNTSLTVDDSTLTISPSAFYGCTGLTSITIPSSVTSIGLCAFQGCTGLTSITISEGVTSIGSSAFEGCTRLTSITISEGVTSIGSSAFKGCTGLTSITIPSSVTSIVNYVFYDCTNLANISYGGDFAGWNKICASIMWCGKSQKVLTIGGDEISGEFTIPEGVTTINNYAFYGCTGLTSITISEGVTSIGSSAFEGCTGLTSITIPSSVTSIGNYAFYGCTVLTSITIPEGVTSIGNYVFYGCTRLTSITIPESVTSIGYDAFDDYSNLANISYGGDFAGWNKICKDIMYYGKSQKVLTIGGNEVSGEFTIPEGVTTINSYAFYNCTGLTSIIIPESVTSIGYNAFYGCTGLTSITIPDSVTSIGSGAFRGCTGLTSITFSGTIAQWKAITKGTYWNYDAGSYTVHCTDGDI